MYRVVYWTFIDIRDEKRLIIYVKYGTIVGYV